MTLSEYLRQRSLSYDPLPIGEKRQFTDEQVAKIASIPEDALIILLQAKIDSIADEIIDNAIPEEVPVLRQSFVEIGSLIDELRKAKKEIQTRREIKDAEKGEQKEEPQTSPPEEGKEGSL